MYDETSGQVYKEWTVPRRSLSARSDRDWSRRRPCPLLVPRGARGPRSLVDMAIDVVANNIGDMAEMHMEHIPTPLLWRIWRFLEARGVCLHAWKLFSALLLREDDDMTLGLYRFRQHICRPGQDLKCYTQPMTSLTTEFITHLVLSGGCSFSTHEMLSLTDIKNLGILELMQPADGTRDVFPQVSDRLIRGWTEKENPFPLLRILRIWGDRSATQKSLAWVSKFPSLVLYDVRGSREDWFSHRNDAIDAGWEVADIIPNGLEDSLLRQLMLLAPTEDRVRDSARSVDSDLISLCSDSRCAVKFVTDRQAPPLLNYLTDTAKVNPSWDPDAGSREAGACHGVAFEAWAFWLYAFIGQLTGDRDLERQGLQSNKQAVAGPFVLPSRPLACLFLGHSGQGGISARPLYLSHGLFATRRYTFTRSVTPGSQLKAPKLEQKPSPVTPGGSEPSLRRRKRKQLHDVLQSLSK